MVFYKIGQISRFKNSPVTNYTGKPVLHSGYSAGLWPERIQVLIWLQGSPDHLGLGSVPWPNLANKVDSSPAM